MTTISLCDKPRERMRAKGLGALSDVELLAILLGTGTRGQTAMHLAKTLLDDIGGLIGLNRQGLGSLCRHNGMGEAKAARVMAALELGIRLLEKRAGEPDGKRFTCSREIYERYGPRLQSMAQEVFLVIGLNNKNQITKEEIVAKGSINECPVHPREVFRPLIMEACARMIAVHNHPSGDPTPSPQDLALTRRLEEVANLIGIPLLDHVIIGTGRYASIRDMGHFQPSFSN